MTWAPDYATAAQVKAWLRIADTVDDTEIASVITACSRAIDLAAGRQFGKVGAAEDRTYEAEFDRHRPRPAWVVPIDDLCSTSGLTVTVAISAVAVTSYTLEPVNALKLGKVYTRLVFGTAAEGYPRASDPQVTVNSANWGWTAVPAVALQALKMQAGRLLARRDSPFGIAGSPDTGSELRLLDRLDPDVALLLRTVRRWEAPAG